ncbi:hypothetical protein BH10PSE7_BH10PSE7_34850 [soil metagenome]
MDSLEILDYASQLKTARGESAILEAASHANECEARGDSEAAENWRRIRSALTTLLGPHAS